MKSRRGEATAGGLEGSYGELLAPARGLKNELLETSWRLTEPSWRLLESLGGVLGSLRGVLGGAGTALAAYKRRLGGSLGRLGAILGALEAMLEPSGGQKAPKIEHKRVPNQRRLELKMTKP